MMTQIIKKEVTWSGPSEETKPSHKELKARILSCLCREVCFVSYYNEVQAVSVVDMKHLATRVHLPYSLVRPIITRFLVNLVYFRRFLRSYKFTYDYTKSLRRLIIYIHKLHRLAPIFDFPRARENARILKHNMANRCFLPQFTTQLAIVLYVTDINDKSEVLAINQTNLRVLCDCSAYAFHRTRNKIGLGSNKSYP